MGTQLREALIDFFTFKEEKFKEYTFGWIEEKKAYIHIQPSHHKPWDLKDRRPFLIAKCRGNYVYFCLFSTSKIEFRCNKDVQYGIVDDPPKMHFEDCYIKDSRLCKYLKGGSKLFKRLLDNGKCQILLRINLRHFLQYITICGYCDHHEVPERIRTILKEEFREWIPDVSKN